MNPPPPSLHPLLSALTLGFSPDQHLRTEATNNLKAWSTTPSFYSSLVEILGDQSLELGPHSVDIRKQAAVQFRQGVDKYWRKGAVNGISAEEKKIIRPKLLQLVHEPSLPVAKGIAAVIAKVARFDYGTDWDDLPVDLLNSLQTCLSQPVPDRLVLHRTLLYLHETIKSLSSNRIMKGRLIMAKIGGILFPTLYQLHGTLLESCVRELRDGREGEVMDIELALVAFKILSKLLIYGFKDPSQDEGARNFFLHSIQAFATLLPLRLTLLQRSPQPSKECLIYLTKHLISFGKLWRNLLKQESAAFVRLGGTEQIITLYWQALQNAGSDVPNLIGEDEYSPYPEKFIVQALLLLNSTMGDWASKSPIDIPPEFVKKFVMLIVTKLLPLRAADLEKWSDDPEEWMNEEEAERWEFELRACAEHVLKSLLVHYSSELGPSMAALLQQVSAPQSMDGLLLKEGVYCAFGRSPSDLQGSIDFDGWLEHTLVQEAAGTDSNYRILRRRIAWLVGNWVAEDLSPPTRTRIYSLLIHLLGRNASTDTAIRLTAGRSLAKCDTWDFDQNSFLPFLPSAIEELVNLLGEVELKDSMMRLNQTLGVIIDRVGLHILPYASRLTEVLGTMWLSASDNSHFQVSVLITITKLAESIGENSQELHQQACPIIQFSNDTSTESYLYLQEDALQLWQVLLRRSTRLSPEMISLLPLLVQLLAAGTDMLPRALKILESYLLLDATQVLQLCSVDLFTSFEFLLGDLKLDSAKVILHGLEMIFETAPIELWAAALDRANLFPKLLYPLQNSETALFVSKYLCTIARIVVAGPETFLQLLQAAAIRLGTTSDNLLELLVTQWLEKIDNMAQGSQRKLTALALAYLLPTTSPVILSRLAEFFSIWASVMAEAQESETGDAEVYQEVFQEGDYDFEETIEATRRSALIARDPVHSIKMAFFLQQKLGEAESLNGGPSSFQARYLSREQVDPGILEEVVKLIKGESVA